jgi:hypothetical protein
MELQAIYTVAELARISGIPSKRLARLLRASGIPLRPAGEGKQRVHLVVTLSDLRTAFPSLWDSIVERQGVLQASLDLARVH